MNALQCAFHDLWNRFPVLSAQNLSNKIDSYDITCDVLGIGLGAEVVAGFADAHHQALAAGFPDTVDTYGLISGLWTSVFALGIEYNSFCFLSQSTKTSPQGPIYADCQSQLAMDFNLPWRRVHQDDSNHTPQTTQLMCRLSRPIQSSC